QASVLRRALYTEQTTRLPDRLLERNDRAAAGAGIQLAMPFVDHRLAEHVSGLPDDRRVRGLATKWIVREAARKLLPDGFACRKGGFRLPVRDWLRNDLGDTLAEHLQSGESQTRRYYDTDVLDRLVREHARRKNNHDKTLWTLLNLEIWHRRYRPG
ncbi:MAG TPA: asparagine synthase-related protein, partial [Burkholderiales bacterium]|nr:asparagine synthase-related protein [Burkholderiales bacterium]